MRERTLGPGYVSLQLGEAASSAAEQHWAQAVVVADDLALVPSPPEVEDRRLVGAHLLVTGAAPRRIGVRLLEVLQLEGRDVCGVALLADRVPGVRRRADHSSDPRVLEEALRKDGTIWPVLLPLVPKGSGPGSDAKTFLDGMPGGLPEVVVRRPPRRSDLATVESIAKSICWWVPWCQPIDLP